MIEDKDIHFLFLGTGAERENLLRLKGQLKLDNVTMLDSVPKSEVSKYISILDVGLVNLKKSKTFESVIPSKIFELAAMHKPILLGVSGESKEMVEEYNVGVGFEPENSAELIYKINYLKENQNKEYGFEEFVSKYKRENLAKQMLLFIKE